MKYTIKKGKQNFKPLDNFLPKFGKKRFEVTFVFDESCYYSLNDWGGDNDFYDLNKLKGVTNFFSANNKQSVMLAWRPVKDALNTFDIFAYVNQKNGDFSYSWLGHVMAGIEETFWLEWEKSKAIFGWKNETYWEEEIKRPCVMRGIGTWIGGENNSKGEFGGVASQDMSLIAKMVSR